MCPEDMTECWIYKAYIRLKKECRRLEKLSIKDELTGYYNYAFLMDTLTYEIERAKRSGQPASIIMADIDHFKRINDTFGHENGNAALRRASRILADNIRKMDFPCRYGGEEFVFILPNASLANAVKMAERLRQNLAAAPLLIKNEPVTLTASLGVEEYDRYGNDTAAGIIARADKLMYQAKQAGRNRICYDAKRLIPPARQLSLQERKALYQNLF